MPRLLARAVVLAALLVLVPLPAHAHATLLSTDPGDGSLLPQPPAAVAMDFDERVTVPPGGVAVLDDQGRHRESGPAVTTRDGRQARVPVALTGYQGSVSVVWRILSDDGHAEAGAWTFAVGHPSSPPARTGAAPRAPAIVAGAARLVTYLGVVAGCAVALVGLALQVPPRRAARPVVAGLAGAGVVTSLAVVPLQAWAATGSARSLADPGLWRQVLDGRSAQAALARAGLLAAAGTLSWWAVGTAPPAATGRPWQRASVVALLAGLTVAVAATFALGGHAAIGPRARILVPVDTLHVTAVTLWLGGLALALATVTAHGRHCAGRGPATAGAAWLARWAPVAAVAVVVVALTGAGQAWLQVAPLPALWSTPYGRLVLVKAAGLVLVLAVAAVARRLLRTGDRVAADPGRGTGGGDTGGATAPRLASEPGRRALVFEAAAAAAVLVAAAALAGTAPARLAYAPAATARLAYHGGIAGDGWVVARLDPAAVGPATLTLVVTDGSGQPIDVALVTADLAPPGAAARALPLQAAGLGTWRSAGLSLPVAGRWQVAVTVQLSETRDASVAWAVVVVQRR